MTRATKVLLAVEAAGAVLVALKLTGTIDWPWKWVLLPVWLPLALPVLAFLLLCVAFALTTKRK